MREIRPYGSVRGVRRKPYPYRDKHPSGAEQRGFYAAGTPRHPQQEYKVLSKSGRREFMKGNELLTSAKGLPPREADFRLTFTAQ